LEQFCTPKVLDTIIDQAKALLGAERGFFKGPRAYCERRFKTVTVSAAVEK